MDEIKLILDSNEYVFYFNNKSELLKIVELPNIKIFINNLIVREVIRNIPRNSVKYFINLLKNPKFMAIKEKMPECLIEKYKKLDLKKGDVVIAALCEYVNVDYFISENRDFLRKKLKKFKVLNIKEFLEMVK